MILSKKAEVDRFLQRPPKDIRAALIHGRDRGGVRERADRLAALVTERPDDPFDVAILTESDIESDLARLEDELSALSMIGGRRLVRLRLGDKAGPAKAASEMLKRHDAGELNPECFFLVEAQALDRSSPLRKTAEAAPRCAALVIYEDEAGDVATLAREALKRDAVSLSAEALDRFIARLPRERGVARQEIERLILYAGPGAARPLGASDLDDFLGVEPEASLFDAAADAFGGRLREAHAAIRRAYADGEGGPAAVRALSMHAGRLRRARVAVEGGGDPTSAAKSAGVFWKQEREFLRQLRAWRMPELESLATDLLDADRLCKTTGSPDPLIAERLAMTVAARARRLGL